MDFSPILPARKNKKKSKKDRRKRNKSNISIVSSPDEEKKAKRCVEGTIKDFRSNLYLSNKLKGLNKRGG